jgi:hypothetical protein
MCFVMKNFAALLCVQSAAQGKAGCADCSLIASGLQADCKPTTV